MLNPNLPFKIEPMTLADIPAVVAIERLSYSMTWPATAYQYELQQNDLAHYFVLRVTAPTPSLQQPASPHAPDELKDSSPSLIVGLGGFWLLSDETHISTIAIHPQWRRLGLGEWLLLTLIETGQTLGATVATLEVRPSNLSARTLYHKYNFRQVGRRSRYYSDNDEDALILTTPPLALPDYQAMLRHHKAALLARLAKINIDKIKQTN